MDISSTSQRHAIATPSISTRSFILAAILAFAGMGCQTDRVSVQSDGGEHGDAESDTTEPGDTSDPSSPEDTGAVDAADDTGEADTAADDTGGADTASDDTTSDDTASDDTSPADSGASDAGDGGATGDAETDTSLCDPNESDETLCENRGVECGSKIVSSSCGQTEITCGECTEYPNSSCENNSCTCMAKTCNQAPGTCGVYSDGCGGTISCTSSCDDTLATGGYHTCFLDYGANEVSCWGWNEYGQLGKGSASTTEYNTPQRVQSNFTSPTSLTAGEDMTCLVDNGDAKCWGANYHGQAVGYQQNSSGNTIKKVLNPTSPQVPGVGIREIEAEVQHTCAITDTQEVYCWGHNWPVADGVLINSSQKTAVKPTQYTFGGLSTARTVDAGALHTCAESTNGELWCWGNDHFGALGDGGSQDLRYHSPRKVNGFAQGFLQVESGGMDTNKGGDGASFVNDFSCAIDVASAAKCWGSDMDGELGNDNNKQTQSGNAAETAPVQVDGLVADVSDLALGGSHACAIQSGDVYCWGGNDHGQIGDGTTTQRNIPVKVTMPNQAYAEDVEAGYFHTCVRLRNDKVACWGRNEEGQLGDGTYTDRDTPVVITP